MVVWKLIDNCFSHRNVFQNDVNALSKMVLKTRFFVIKLKISCSLDDFVQIPLACGTNNFKGMYGET